MAGARRRAGIVLTLFFLLQIAMPLCSGYEPQGVPSTIKTPQDIEKWFSSLKSQMTLPDVPQTVQEMLESRAGDCDDFATLASKILADLGISSEVLVIQYTGTPLRHAICLWVDENGNRYDQDFGIRVEVGPITDDMVVIYKIGKIHTYSYGYSPTSGVLNAEVMDMNTGTRSRAELQLTEFGKK